MEKTGHTPGLTPLEAEMLATLKRLADGACHYSDANIVIRCDTHTDAMVRMTFARKLIAKAESLKAQAAQAENAEPQS
ncbi:MAG: hypothetical protein KAH44_29030 [Oricola sp.]|jgi:hypothetical protein|nr:hypothetical protein [Oricola sp.]